VVCKGLKDGYPGKVLCQGVGGAYSAGILDNVQPKGTTAGAIAEATKMFTTASQKCPKSFIIFGGYRSAATVLLLEYMQLVKLTFQQSRKCCDAQYSARIE
jgi:cutinase